jgi:hypothetical protein
MGGYSPGFNLLKIHLTQGSMKSNELLEGFRVIMCAPLQPSLQVIIFHRNFISALGSNKRSFLLHIRDLLHFALHDHQYESVLYHFEALMGSDLSIQLSE